MKPCKGERTGLSTVINRVNFCLLVVLITQESFPQIPINGFCKFSSYRVEAGYNSFFPLNFNQDSFTDFALYNSGGSKAVLVEGKAGGDFSSGKKINLPSEITKIQPIYTRSKRIKGFAFTSRKNLKAGVYTFNKYGRAVIQKEFNFKSYPENISAADVNLNGDEELLISGASFQGLSLLFQDGNQLREKKIVNKNLYTNAVFTDLSSDGYPDIAAFNLTANEIVFYFNNGSGNFEKIRSIKQDNPIYSLRSVDLNLDYYDDLLFIKGGAIQIIYGDSISSYRKITTLRPKYAPDKIITGDFNKDGRIDIAYLSRKNGAVSVFFAKDDFDFYNEMSYIKENGISDINPFYSRFIDAIAVLSSEGKLYLLSSIASISQEVCIKASIAPSAVNYFDYENNSLTDICYIDDYSKSLNFIIRNSEGILYNHFSVSLYEKHSSILVDNTFPEEKTFVCYTNGKSLIEIIKVNFSGYKVERTTLYSPGVIQELKIKRNNDTGLKIYLSYMKESELETGVFEFRDFRYKLNNFDLNDSFTVASSLEIKNHTALNYVKRRDDSLYFYRKIFRQNKPLPSEFFSFHNDTLKSIVIFSEDLLNIEEASTISFISTYSRNKILISIGESENYLKEENLPENFSIEKKSQLYFGAMKSNGLKKLFSYIPASNSLYKFDFIRGGSRLILTKLFDDVEIESYFIRNMNTRNVHLVYTNKSNRCIFIKPLP